MTSVAIVSDTQPRASDEVKPSFSEADIAMTDYRTQATNKDVTHVEEPLSPPLHVVDLKQAAASVDQAYKNFVVLNVNHHCIRLAVMQGEFRWHRHPHSDECFLVLEGELEIDIAGGQRFRLVAGQALTIPMNVIHRTHARTRTVNLCFEDRDTYTDVVFEDVELASG